MLNWGVRGAETVGTCAYVCRNGEDMSRRHGCGIDGPFGYHANTKYSGSPHCTLLWFRLPGCRPCTRGLEFYTPRTKVVRLNSNLSGTENKMNRTLFSSIYMGKVVQGRRPSFLRTLLCLLKSGAKHLRKRTKICAHVHACRATCTTRVEKRSSRLPSHTCFLLRLRPHDGRGWRNSRS